MIKNHAWQSGENRPWLRGLFNKKKSRDAPTKEKRSSDALDEFIRDTTRKANVKCHICSQSVEQCKMPMWFFVCARL